MDRREDDGHVSGLVSGLTRTSLHQRRVCFDDVRALMNHFRVLILLIDIVDIVDIVVVIVLFRFVVSLCHVAVEEFLHLSLGHVWQAIHEIFVSSGLINSVGRLGPRIDVRDLAYDQLSLLHIIVVIVLLVLPVLLVPIDLLVLPVLLVPIDRGLLVVVLFVVLRRSLALLGRIEVLVVSVLDVYGVHRHIDAI